MKKSFKNDLVITISSLMAALLVYIVKGVVIIDYAMIILSVYLIFNSLLEIKKERFNSVIVIIIGIFSLFFILQI